MLIRKLKGAFLAIIALMAVGLNEAYPSTIGLGSGEKAFLHTDREVYVGGETLFFKLYIIDEATHKLSGISKIAYLVLRNNTNSSIARLRLKLDKGTSFGSIFLSDTLSSGPYQLTAFTNWMRNSGDSSFFSKEIFIANRFDKDLSSLHTFSGAAYPTVDSAGQNAGNPALIIATDKPEYNKREKINLNLVYPGLDKHTLANLSVSVSEDIPGRENNLSINDYLRPKSHMADSANFPHRKNPWYLPEQQGEVVEGKVIDQRSNVPVANTCVFLSAADSFVNLQYAFTDSHGLFRFLLNDYYNEKDVFYSIKNDQSNRKYLITLEDKFALANNFIPAENPENRSLKEYIQKSQDIVTVLKIYQPVTVSDMKRQPYAGSNFHRIYYKPDYSIRPSEYIPLNDFPEISKEILPPQIRLRKQNGLYEADLADETLHVFMDQEAAIFLDGVLLSSVNPVIPFGSGKIRRVELVCARFNFGDLLFPGIVAVFSNNNEIQHVSPFSSMLHTYLDPYPLFSTFTIQDYSKIPLSKADFRQVLYWNPEIEISRGQKQVCEFYSSDHTGNYIIRVEGISSNGDPISAIARIKVN